VRDSGAYPWQYAAMNAALIPEWIKREAERQERETLQANTDSDSKTVAELTIKAETPEYMRQFVKELMLAADGLSELPQNVAGSVLYRPSEAESQCRVSVQRLGLVARQTYTDLFHTANSLMVRCHTLGGKAFQLHFSVRPDGRGIGLIASDSFAVMNPEKAAEYIVRPMMQWVLGSSASLY
jgi:hypothetical protein